tara:strand:- start:776 stop:1306 length:531 start_codon:yes stop_codon:yes gene_type:complete
MAQSHEKLVEEWLRRNRYFTIRSAKIGVSEIDLLALGEQLVKTSENNLTTKIIRRHVEVQISFKPVGFITGKSAKKRSKEQIEIDVDMWLHKKFFCDDVNNIRTAFLGRERNIKDWKFDFVHHIVKEPYELELIEKKGIGLIDFKDIITELRKDDGVGTARRGSDAADEVSLLKMK